MKKRSNIKEETYLAKWINDGISDADLKKRVSLEDFLSYKKIKEGLEQFEMPPYEQNAAFADLEKKLQKSKKVRKLVPFWAYTIAASVAVLISTYFFYGTGMVSHETSFGEQKDIVLVDGSKVSIAAKSKISYSEKEWENDRRVHLEGEAYFRVQKGSTFTVVSKEGEVTVLGTQFNVRSNDAYFEVLCFEGRVSVTKGESDVVLTEGKAYRKFGNQAVENWDFQQKIPSWLYGESSFKSTPLKQVIRALENQFHLTITGNDIDDSLLFTGSFDHSNRELAFKAVFLPMGIDYRFKNNNQVILTNK